MSDEAYEDPAYVRKALRYIDAFKQMAQKEEGVSGYDSMADALLDTKDNPFAARFFYYQDEALQMVKAKREDLAVELAERQKKVKRLHGEYKASRDEEVKRELQSSLRKLVDEMSDALREVLEEAED